MAASIKYFMLCLMIATHTHLNGCVLMDVDPLPAIEVTWPQGRIQVETPRIPMKLEFSEDNQYLAMWFRWPNDGVHWRVFRVDGSAVPEAIDHSGRLMPSYERMFSRVAMRTSHARTREETEFNLPYTYSPRLLQEAEKWAFNITYTSLVRVMNVQSPVMELWNLENQPRLIWSSQRVLKRGLPQLIDFIDDNDGGNIVVVDGESALIVARDTGNVLNDLSIACSPNKEQYLRWAFTPGPALLAKGFYGSRHLCVTSIKSPGKTLLEAHTQESPDFPPGGSWRPESLDIVGGRYLVAGFRFDGRSSPLRLLPTEIFDLNSGKMIWMENSTNIGPVTVSGDGRLLAFVIYSPKSDKLYLEIGPFVPNLP